MCRVPRLHGLHPARDLAKTRRRRRLAAPPLHIGRRRWLVAAARAVARAVATATTTAHAPPAAPAKRHAMRPIVGQQPEKGALLARGRSEALELEQGPVAAAPNVKIPAAPKAAPAPAAAPKASAGSPQGVEELLRGMGLAEHWPQFKDEGYDDVKLVRVMCDVCCECV